VIYHLRTSHEQIWLLTLYDQTKLGLSLPACSEASWRISMASRKRNIGREILDGIREIKLGKHGRVTTIPSVTKIRAAFGLSQSDFAGLLGVSVRTLQEWEQGRRAPTGAARTLLRIAEKNPAALLEFA